MEGLGVIIFCLALASLLLYAQVGKAQDEPEKDDAVRSMCNFASSKGRATWKRPSDRGSFGKWSVPHLCCQMQRGRGCGGVAVFDLLSLLQHCSPHREQRAEGLLAGLLSKAREPGWVQTPLLWGTVWLSA